MTDDLNSVQPTEKPPHSIAFVVDGFVQDVIHVQPRLAAIFLSEPIAVDVTGAVAVFGADVSPGFQYDVKTNTFTDFKNNKQVITNPPILPNN
jgi:hypothetical protein